MPFFSVLRTIAYGILPRSLSNLVQQTLEVAYLELRHMAVRVFLIYCFSFPNWVAQYLSYHNRYHNHWIYVLDAYHDRPNGSLIQDYFVPEHPNMLNDDVLFSFPYEMVKIAIRNRVPRTANGIQFWNFLTKSFSCLLIWAIFNGDGINETSQSSFTTRPIHQSLLYFSIICR